MNIAKQTLEPTSGFSTLIGFYLSGMEEVREQLRDATKDLSDEEISAEVSPKIHSIGQLILHNAEAEWWWLCHVVAGKDLNEMEAGQKVFWDVLLDEDFASKKYSLEFCWSEADKVRQSGLEILKGLTDEDLDKFHGWNKEDGTRIEKSLRWILHHLIDHEAQHKGQVFMIKRLIRDA